MYILEVQISCVFYAIKFDYIIYIYWQCMHIVFSAMSKSLKRLPNCPKIAETSVILIIFNGVLCEVRAYTLTLSCHHSTCTWIKYQNLSYIFCISLSVMVYNKYLSSQCSLTAQIEPVQDKKLQYGCKMWTGEEVSKIYTR